MKRIGKLLCLLLTTCAHAAPPSLPNLANSCYMNSLLQNLFNIPELTTIVLDNRLEFKNNNFALAYINLLTTQNFTTGIRSVDYNHLVRFYNFVKNCIQCPRFKPATQEPRCDLASRQEDVTEFFNYFIDKALLGENVPKFLQNFITNLIEIRLNVTNIKKSTETVSEEVYYYLPLKFVDGGNTLKELISAFFAPAIAGDSPIEEENPLQLKQLKKSSHYFIVAVNRIEQPFGGYPHRIATSLQVPHFLDLGEYQGTSSDIYELIGVSCHIGTVNFGHYYAYIKDQHDAVHPWYKCDDNTITFIGGNLSDFAIKDINDNCYMLFYKKAQKLDDSLKKISDALAILSVI